MIVDYSELAVAGYLPTASEYSDIRMGAEEQHRELASLDEEIAILENRLTHLRAYRIKLWRSCTSSAGLMAPVRKLPREILGDIFVMLLPSISWQEVGTRNHWFFRYKNPYNTHSTIQSICRHWSAVLSETPRMWSTIIIRGPLQIAQIEQVFHRSKSCPLDFYVGEIAWDKLKMIKFIVERHAASKRLLCVEPSMGQFFEHHTTLELPNLQYLSFHRMLPPTRIIHAPNLSSLRIRRESCYPRTVSELDVLKHFPNLQFLDWQDYNIDHIAPHNHLQMDKLHLSFLEVFKITVPYSLLAQGILHRLCAPTLKSFTLGLTGPFRVQTGTPALHLLLGKKVLQLCNLSLCDIRYEEDYEFGSFLNHFPSLTTLCLTRCKISSIFFPSFIQDPVLHKSSGLRLKTLHLRFTTLSASNLAKFIRSHALPDSIRTDTRSAGLQEVLIEGWQHMCLGEKEERLQLIRLREEHAKVVVTGEIRDYFEHDFSLNFHEAKRMRRTAGGDHATSI
ncbi:hypothetical protein K439DRAFT_1418309 [Ramaria rubella]|nr:hypothetical protein K439DRAFT_1418309 [Ramaria rubella]